MVKFLLVTWSYSATLGRAVVFKLIYAGVLVQFFGVRVLLSFSVSSSSKELNQHSSTYLGQLSLASLHH